MATANFLSRPLNMRALATRPARAAFIICLRCVRLPLQRISACAAYCSASLWKCSDRARAVAGSLICPI